MIIASLELAISGTSNIRQHAFHRTCTPGTQAVKITRFSGSYSRDLADICEMQFKDKARAEMNKRWLGYPGTAEHPWRDGV
jgi:hypothetical protein